MAPQWPLSGDSNEGVSGGSGSRVRVRRSNSGYGMLAPSGALDETQTKGREIGPLHPLVHVSANPCRIGFVSACEDSLVRVAALFCIQRTGGNTFAVRGRLLDARLISCILVVGRDHAQTVE